MRKIVKPKRRMTAKVGEGVQLGNGHIVTEQTGLKRSATVTVFDLPIAALVEHRENPNEQSEKTFDQLVDRIRTEGLDEPIMVYPELKNGQPTQKFVIFSGHHRLKAAKVVGLTVVPVIIREGWDEDRAAIELVTRNNLKGTMNPHKFTELYQRLEKRYDPEQLKRMMGFTEKKAFEQLFKQVRDQLGPKQKKKLDEAKETVKSVEDLSSVLNTIFKNHGSEVDHSFMVFTFGGKQHYYIQVDTATAKMLKALQDRTEDEEPLFVGKVFKAFLDSPELDNVIGKLKRNGEDKTPSPSDAPAHPKQPKRRPATNKVRLINKH